MWSSSHLNVWKKRIQIESSPERNEVGRLGLNRVEEKWTRWDPLRSDNRARAPILFFSSSSSFYSQLRMGDWKKIFPLTILGRQTGTYSTPSPTATWDSLSKGQRSDDPAKEKGMADPRFPSATEERRAKVQRIWVVSPLNSFRTQPLRSSFKIWSSYPLVDGFLSSVRLWCPPARSK